MAQDEEQPPEPKPPAIPAGNWPRPVAPSPPVEAALEQLLRELTPAAPEREPWSRGRVCAAIPVPFALAAVSWTLGGNNVWAWTAGVSGVLLLLWGVASLEVLRDRDFQLRDFLVTGFVVLCWGAWAAVGYYFPLTAVRLKDGDEEEPVGPVRLSYDGEVRFEGERRQIAFEIRGRLDPARLKIESLAPTGWAARTFRASSDEVTLEKLPTTIIYFDNRDHKVARLVCGQLSVTVAANTKERVRVPALAPGTACPLLLDGKEIGTLGEKDVFVDAFGTRSYRWRTITYGGPLEQVMALNPQGVVPPRDDFELFRAGHVHELRGKVDFFLEPAPNEIKVRTIGPTIGGRETRTELVETP
jgi:hypothetical protein